MRDIPDDLRAALAARYAVERVVGRGGMATVYLARDLKHGRDVAVKVLRPDLAATIGVERFFKEIEIAARLNHPHILTLIDSGEAGGFVYFVMPYVAGESLRGLLNREMRLAPHVMLAIVREVAGALAYAHRRGVIHRDVKPANILLAEGHAVVTDFGIAKAVLSAGTPQLTRSGFPLGTPGYMSPEQAAGVASVDARSDVYSLACVAYEALIGETPGLWLTDEAVRLRRFVDAEPEHRRRLDELPPRLEQALVRALAMRRDVRCPSPDEFARDFEAALAPGQPVADEEAQAIIRRAAELEVTAPSPDAGDEVTLGAVQRIAAEAGIPPAQVSDAARAAEASTEGLKPGGAFGLGPKLQYDRSVNVEVRRADFGRLLEEIQVSLDEPGQLSPALDNSLVWSADPKARARRAQVLVVARDGRTRIRVTDEEVVPAGMALIPIGAGCAVLFGIVGAITHNAGLSDLLAAVIGFGVSGSGFAGAYLVVRRMVRRQLEGRHRKLSALVGRLEAIVLQRGRRAELGRPLGTSGEG